MINQVSVTVTRNTITGRERINDLRVHPRARRNAKHARPLIRHRTAPPALAYSSRHNFTPDEEKAEKYFFRLP